MTPVTDPAILAQLNGNSGKPVTDPAVLAQLNGPQPSVMDRIVASPIGRFAHDNIVAPAMGVINALGMPEGAGGMGMAYDGPHADLATPVENGYQGALSANRNTPGYASARQFADKATAMRAPGFTDQMLPGVFPALAGAVSLPGGLDASNAAADSQAAAQQDYAGKNPVSAFGANVMGGFMAPPAGAIPKIPAIAASGTPTIRPFASQATAAGYKLPPRMISSSPGIVADTAAGMSGKVKLAQAASAANQEVTNRLAVQSLGLPADTVLTDNVLKDVRKNAGAAYGAIPKALPKVAVDPDFYAAVSKIGDKSSAAASEFPDLLENPEIDKLTKSLGDKTEFSADAGISLVRKLRSNAAANFRSAGDPAKLDLAFAQRQAADAVDDLIERNLAATGQGDLAGKYRIARQMIAKAHDVEAATNTTTGNVSAKKIAALSNRGRPLTGGLSTIADTANAFPKAMQSEAAFGEVEPISVLDMAAGAAALPHNPSLLGAVLGRPLARKAVLSAPAQSRMVNSAMKGAMPPMFQMPKLPVQPLSPLGLLSPAPLMLPKNSQ